MGFDADLYTKRMFQLLLSAYSTLTIRDLALFLGMTEDDATTCKLLSAISFAFKRLTTSSHINSQTSTEFILILKRKLSGNVSTFEESQRVCGDVLACFCRHGSNDNHIFCGIIINNIIVIFFWWIYTDVVENGWTVDSTSQMVTVKKQAVKREQKVDSSKLQRLTEYVFHLEH